MLGLRAQMRRAAVSVPVNLAERTTRKTTPELIQVLYVANGSLSELDTHREIAVQLGYVCDVGSTRDLVDSVQGQS